MRSTLAHDNERKSTTARDARRGQLGRHGRSVAHDGLRAEGEGDGLVEHGLFECLTARETH